VCRPSVVYLIILFDRLYAKKPRKRIRAPSHMKTNDEHCPTSNRLLSVESFATFSVILSANER
jgi:hypothetical protein